MQCFDRSGRSGRVFGLLSIVLGGVVLTLTACGGEEQIMPVPPEFSEGKPPLQKPPANQVGGFSMQLPDEVLAPGEERQICYLVPMDIQGPSRVVGGGKLTTGPGMHHGNITSQKKTGDGIRVCPPDGGFGGEAGDILDGGAVLFASSTQITGEEWQSFPDEMGFPIRDGYKIVARMHYLNATANPMTVAPKYEWYTIDEAKITHLLGPFIWIFKNFQIPPKSELTVTGGCRVPEPMQLVNLLPHMHALGTAFTADFIGGALDGKRFLNSTGYNPDTGVWTQYRPAIDLSQGEGARFSCTWNNTFDKPIVEGTGDNEMCMLFGYGYPYNNAFSAFATGPESCVVIAPPPL